MLPRQPTSTLFPYTTLFRSDLDEALRPLPEEQVPRVGEDLEARAGDPLGEQLRVARIDHQDRKSTRLNSSHQIISYAVFCLKKKKKKKIIRNIHNKTTNKKI